MTEQPARFWTNPSVLRFAGSVDPLEAIAEHSRRVVLDAIEAGWEGPPFDPFELAERLSLNVVPKDDLTDAQTVPTGSRGLRIEFNPNRPPGRVRYSLAHEIAHTFFPDCGEVVRQRAPHSRSDSGDTWQLELLCNFAAAELLMPIGTLPELGGEPISVDMLMNLRKRYDVSTEAMFLRVARITDQPCAVFAAARVLDESNAPFRIDYVVTSRNWHPRIPVGQFVAPTSALGECTAVGFTAKGDMKLAGTSTVRVECVGAPPYPSSRYPRVIGLLKPKGEVRVEEHAIRYLRGDALDPRGSGYQIIAHVVNDKTPTWGGGGFAVQLRRRWPVVQEDFQTWASSRSSNLRLGRTHVTLVEDSLAVFHMVAQHGYGPSANPRLRYSSLRDCLVQLAAVAERENASVHLPRTGAGNAGGSWPIISELIEETLVARGIDVTVYALPGDELPVEAEDRQLALI